MNRRPMNARPMNRRPMNARPMNRRPMNAGATGRGSAVLGLVLLGAVCAGPLAAAGCRPAAPGRDALQQAFAEDGLGVLEARGHRLFRKRCATCHGPQGRGDGQNAYNLDPPPPDFQQSLAALSPADRRRLIEGGTAALGRSPLCPPWGRTLDADEVDALLAWLETAARPAPAVPEDGRGGHP